MEDTIEVILQDHGRVLPTSRPHPILSACTGALLTGLYGVWCLFVIPGFRKVPWKLKVPYLPSSKDQTLNTMKLLEGRTGRLADLGSGDGRLVSEMNLSKKKICIQMCKFACKVGHVKLGFQGKCTDLSSYNNVTAFLAPGVMRVLGEKLLKELPDDARVIACRFPFPNWPQQSSAGSGLDQTFAYDMDTVRSHLRNVTNTVEE
uniref:Si:dkey-190g11.3 n=1 Tax=Acanthochromis polyacanthus TaxID=80966 RepID=A0A3Q1G150_9TELE